MEDFDHVCPWTGTAIAKRNQLSFKIFLCSLIFFCLYMAAMFAWADAHKEQYSYHAPAPAYYHRPAHSPLRPPVHHAAAYYTDGYNL
jgi:hypothetical protein